MRSVVSYLALLLLLSLFLSPVYAQTYRINAGGSDYTDVDGNVWEADKAYVAGDYGYEGGATRSFTNDIAGTEDDELFQNLRVGRDIVFSYTFDNLESADYEITLHFMEPLAVGSGLRMIDINAEGVTVINDMDIYANAGDINTAWTETVTVTVTDGTLDLDIIPLSTRPYNQGFVAGISVINTADLVEEPDINVLTTSLDFGTVDIGDTSSLTFDIENTGSDTLSVDSLVSSNGVYTAISPATPFEVDSGATTTVTVEFIPTADQTEDGNLDIFSDDPDEGTVTVTLTGVGNSLDPDIDVSPLTLDFGSVNLEDSLDLTVTITNEGENDLNVTDLVSSNSVYTVIDATPIVVANGTPVDITVRYLPTADSVQTGDLDIISDDPDEGTVTVALTGQGSPVDPEIDVSPLSLDFGSVNVNDSTDLTVTITNLGVNDLTVDDLISTNTAFEIVDSAPITVANGTPVDITVRFKPTVDVTENGDLEIVSDDADEDTVVVSLTGIGLSTDPDIDVSPLSLDFGTIDTGTTSDLTVTIDNLGVDDVTVDSITIDNAKYSVTTPTTPFTVVAGTPTDVTVQFAPDTALTEAGTMTVHSNDPDEATIDVSLTGTGSDVPDIDYRINAGGTADYTDALGDVWEADPAHTTGGYGYSGGLTTSWTDPVANTEDDDLYNDMRYQRDTGFSYLFDIADGDYDIELHFIDPTSSSSGNRTMDVTVEGTVVLDDLDIFDLVGVDAAHVEYLNVNVSDGQLNIDFDPATGDGRLFISAIRVTTGAPPPQEADISVSTTSLDFGGVDTSAFADLTFTISNLGLDDLEVTDMISSNGVFTVESPATPFTVVNGTPETVTVRFSPTVVATENADLDIVSDDVDEDTVTVTLTGVGTDPGAGPTWQDFAAANGITHVHSFGNGPTCSDPEVSSGGAWGDYDGDGDLDLYVTQYDGDNILYRNDGDTNGDGVPNFVDAITAANANPAVDGSIGATFVDYDNDGDQDLFVTNYGPNILYENDGTGVFTDVTATAGVAGNTNRRSMGVAWADYDQDGWVDLYVTQHRYCQGEADQATDELWKNNGDGTFTEVSDELCISGVANEQCDELNGLGFSPAFFDYDDDGDLDLYVINDDLGGNRGNVIWRNDGSDGSGGWLWTDVTDASGLNQVESGMGLGIGDIDNDGWFDVCFSNIEKNWLLRNNGDATYSDYTFTAGVAHEEYENGEPSITWSVMMIDYDNDMWVDLFYSNGEISFGNATHHDNTWYHNDGDGTFTEVSAESGADNTSRGRHTAAADINDDGFLDYFEAAIDDPAYLYINNSAAQGITNNWVKITAEGTDSNRDALGTKFTLVTEDGTSQIRFMTSGHHHMGGDEKAIYFGLGSNESADLTIRWPNGEEETFTDIATNAVTHYVEPAAGTTAANQNFDSQRDLKVPAEFKLHQNYPNPFNPVTTIRYDIPADSDVTLKIYSVLGEEVRTLVSDNQSAGFHSVQWDGRDNNGNKLASGIYIYRLKAGAATHVKKMSLIQ